MGIIYRTRSSFTKIEELNFRVRALEQLIENQPEKK
jgi:hypothetical protein